MGEAANEISGSKLVPVVVAHERQREIRLGRLFFIQGVEAVGSLRGLKPCVLLGREQGFQPHLTVTFSPENGGEHWVRDFGGKRFSSVQAAGTGKDEHLLVERFGPASFALALVAEEGRLVLIPRRWSFLGIPMPRFLLPTGLSFETERDGQFCFDVEISMPLVGLIVAYRGALSQS